jgi:hypothetical protein
MTSAPRFPLSDHEEERSIARKSNKDDNARHKDEVAKKEDSRTDSALDGIFIDDMRAKMTAL